MAWVVFAVVMRFLAVGFGLCGCMVLGFGFFSLWVLWPAVVVGSDVCVVCFGFWDFFILWVLWPAVVFSGGGGGFQYGVDLQWRML